MAPPTGPIVAKHAARVLGGSASVFQYHDDARRHSQPILICRDSPTPGTTTASTVQLHLSPNPLDDRDIRVELMMRAPNEIEAIANVVATCAFHVAVFGWLAAPGVVFPDVVGAAIPGTSTPHVVWSEPFDAEELGAVELDGVGLGGIGPVHWLLGVPVSDAEVQLLHEQGYDVLQRQLTGVAYVDPLRPSSL